MSLPSLTVLFFTVISAIYISAIKFNSLTTGRFWWNFRKSIFRDISCEIVCRWMSLNLTDGKSTLVQVIAWCLQGQTTTHYLSQCWLRSVWPYGIINPYWVNVCIWNHSSRYISLVGVTLEQSIAVDFGTSCFNSLWPNDTVWLSLVQIICCLMAPNHNLNQCWAIVNEAHYQHI